MIFIFFIFFNLFFSLYSLNNYPVQLYSKNLKNINNLKVLEPINFENKKKLPAFVFFSGLRGKIPYEIYNNFLNNIASTGISCFIINNDIENSNILIEYLEKNYANITLSGHSSGGSKALEIYSDNEHLNNLILFDPVDDRIINNNNKLEYMYNNFFDKSKNKIEINNIQNYLLVKAEKSYKWSIFPPKMPFIPIFDINEKILNMKDDLFIIKDIVDETVNENDETIKITKTISKKINNNKKVIEINDFGHTDLLDEYWTNIMNNFLNNKQNKNNNNKDDNSEDNNLSKLNVYHEFNAYLVNQICYNRLENINDNLKKKNKFKNIKYKISDI